jgi:hypothetical protein
VTDEIYNDIIVVITVDSLALFVDKSIHGVFRRNLHRLLHRTFTHHWQSTKLATFLAFDMNQNVVSSFHNLSAYCIWNGYLQVR